ncbi:MAG TPA: ZIP family metal transporter [Solirubrobacteraceae bacterium]|nr:ZIP family metal transporter [Solirubrobacteraceae bacterium]
MTALPFARTLALGAIAGITIFIGLPLGRVRKLSPRVRLALAMLSVGILAFIFVDVASHGIGLVEERLLSYKHGHASLLSVIGLFALLCAGFGAGAVGIGGAERALRGGARGAKPLAGGATGVLVQPQAAAIGGAQSDAAQRARAQALQTGMTVAAAIGLHNFAEGLAIGVSASTGAVTLATVLVIGFAAHNATEGFGIVGPLGGVRPSWRWLVGAGLLGGGPTFLGTLIGYQVSSAALELLFYALAAGALMFVIGEIWSAMRRFGHRELALAMLSVGFLLGVATDLIVTYGGG